MSVKHDTQDTPTIWTYNHKSLNHDQTPIWIYLFLLTESLDKFLLLGSDTVFSSLPGFLNLHTAGLGLVAQHLGTGLLSLLLVDEFHQDSLVLEHVTYRTKR